MGEGALSSKVKKKQWTMEDRQEKGQRLQRKLSKRIVELVPELTSDVVKSNPPHKHGEDILMSTKAKELLNIKVECKNLDRFKTIYSHYDYACKHDGEGESILVINDESLDREPLAIMDSDYFIKILQRLERYRIWINKQIKNRHS